MTTISFAEILHDPCDFIRRIKAGESMLIVCDGRPVAEVLPVAAAELDRRPFGLCEGEFTVPDGFDNPLPDDILDDFEGRT